MNSRLFHLKDVSCKIVNCTHVAKIENMTNKTKSIEIDRSFCIELYTNIKSFGPALLRPPLYGPSLLSAPAELVFTYLTFEFRGGVSMGRFVYLSVCLAFSSPPVDRSKGTHLYVYITRHFLDPTHANYKAQ